MMMARNDVGCEEFASPNTRYSSMLMSHVARTVCEHQSGLEYYLDIKLDEKIPRCQLCLVKHPYQRWLKILDPFRPTTTRIKNMADMQRARMAPRQVLLVVKSPNGDSAFSKQ